MSIKRDMIPVVFATDDEYVLPTCVAICSIMEHTELNYLEIYVLIAAPLSESSSECFELLQKRYLNCQISFIIVDKSVFDEHNLTIERISVATMYRLLLPQIFPKERECLYLDSDILVLDDIAKFQEVDVSDYCMAGVKDDELIPIESHMRVIDTEVMRFYLNAGALLLNLEVIRNKKLDNLLVLESRKRYPFQDQDVLNSVLFPHIKVLPLKYNCFNRIEQRPSDVIVLHMSGGPDVQAWQNKKVKGADMWWEYADLFSETQVYRRSLEKIRRYELDRDLNYIVSRCMASCIVYIWGFTQRACNLYRALKIKGVTAKFYFVDNRREKQNYTFENVQVIGPEKINMCAGSLVINTVQNRRREIDSQMDDMMIKNEMVIQYVEKTSFYYRALRPEYLKTEIAEKVLIDYGIDYMLND